MSPPQPDPQPAALPPAPAPATWQVVCAAVFGGLVLIFFMVLIVLSVFGFTIPTTSSYLVILVFGIFGGLAFAFVGGVANANGVIPLPKGLKPIQFQVAGGIGAMVICMLIAWLIIPTDNLPVLARIDEVKAMPGPKLIVQTHFTVTGRDSTQTATIEASWAKDFHQPAYRKNLDNPEIGKATFELAHDDRKSGDPFWVRVYVKNRQDQYVGKSELWEAKVPKGE